MPRLKKAVQEKGLEVKRAAGRPTGTRGRVGLEVRANILQVFDELGGVSKMVEWAKSDPDAMRAFYQIYAKLAPIETRTEVDVIASIDINQVDTQLQALIGKAAGKVVGEVIEADIQRIVDSD